MRISKRILTVIVLAFAFIFYIWLSVWLGPHGTPLPDYTLTVDPTHITISRGETATINVILGWMGATHPELKNVTIYLEIQQNGPRWFNRGGVC